MSEQFTTPEQALIERLGRAPQPELSLEARNAIHTRILIAFENPPTPAPQPYITRPWVWVAVLVVGALIASGVLFVLSQQPPAPPTLLPTAPATAIPATPIPAVIGSPVPEATSTATLTLSPTFTTTASLTLSPTFTSTPTIAPTVTANVNTISIIEGPVDQINENVITIYNIPVHLAPDDPLLPVIVIGDIVHVEGNTQNVDGQIVVIAITVTITTVDEDVNPVVNTNPSTGDVWRDDGTCANPPPDWAPANGWRRRCQGQTNNSQNPPNNDQGNNGQGQNNQGNNGQGQNNDDDD